jgi:hypothetical protein
LVHNYIPQRSAIINSNMNTDAQRGVSILGVVVLGFLLILVLSYFNISIKSTVESPTGQDNIHYVGGGAKSLWVTYLKEPLSYFWNEIWIKLFWNSFKNNLERIRDGKPTDVDNAATHLQVQINQ